MYLPDDTYCQVCGQVYFINDRLCPNCNPAYHRCRCCSQIEEYCDGLCSTCEQGRRKYQITHKLDSYAKQSEYPTQRPPVYNVIEITGSLTTEGLTPLTNPPGLMTKIHGVCGAFRRKKPRDLYNDE